MAIKLVKTNYGMVKGLPSGIPTVSVFKGIPYAKPPVGELRWKEPQPPEPWDGVLEAYSFKAMALQDKLNVAHINMVDFCDYGIDEANSEDCLYLNVWTPARSADEKLPVMIWIHGGGFVEDYGFNVVVDGDKYASVHGVILVSFEYRLGALGFMAHSELTAESEHHASGNYGLLDQRFAIQWVKENIAGFGGDPENITIFGESAGAFSVSYQICSKLNEGLFQKAIMQSGVGMSNKVSGSLLGANPLVEAEELGMLALEWLGVNSIEEARKVPAEKFIEMQRRPEFRFRPIVDGYFIDKTTDESIHSGEYMDIPIIIGCNEREGNLFKAQGAAGFTINEDDFRSLIEENLGDLAPKYFEICGFEKDPFNVLDTYGDRGFMVPTISFCENATKFDRKSPTYMYFFTRKVPGDDIGPAHAMEMMYSFNTIHRNWRPMVQKDMDVANTMSSYWCNFGKNGDPNGENLPRWDAYTSYNRKAMEIGEKICMIDRPGSPTVDFEVDYTVGNL